MRRQGCVGHLSRKGGGTCVSFAEIATRPGRGARPARRGRRRWGLVPRTSRRAEAFNERSRLRFSIAYRMLGSASRPRGGSSRRCGSASSRPTATASSSRRRSRRRSRPRLSINVLQSARVRRETAIGPTPSGGEHSGVLIPRGAERSEALEFAMPMLLEKSHTTERAAYVLREAPIIRTSGSRRSSVGERASISSVACASTPRGAPHPAPPGRAAPAARGVPQRAARRRDRARGAVRLGCRELYRRQRPSRRPHPVAGRSRWRCSSPHSRATSTGEVDR